MSDQVCVLWGCPSVSPAPARSRQALPTHQHSVLALRHLSFCRAGWSDPWSGGPSVLPLLAQPRARVPRGGCTLPCATPPPAAQHGRAPTESDRGTWPFKQHWVGLSCD